ncbi:MAG TPA: tRNA dihydrouridine synthase DusB [Treponemataceae bacterium]|nr:tRNA dihydrouridine synthase DusB [Treponemataceae bacterium]
MSIYYHPASIGDLLIPGNLFLAPVAGYSDRSFRSVCIKGGASLCYTEMVSSEALYRGSGKTQQLLLRAENEKLFAVQLFGGDPHAMQEAAGIVIRDHKPSLIDINAGCPVPKIIKSGAGSALTKDPEHLYAITRAVVQAAGETPVTVKIRSGWDAQNLTWKEAALAAYEAGAKAVTIHARTRAQGYEGKADWTILAELVKVLKNKIPVFGSGDVFSPEDAKSMFEQTDCCAVMFARGAMGNPFIFRQTIELLTTGTYNEIDPAERIRAGMEELELLIEDTGELSACREMRKRFCGYSKGLLGGPSLRSAIVKAEKASDYKGIFSHYLL